MSSVAVLNRVDVLCACSSCKDAKDPCASTHINHHLVLELLFVGLERPLVSESAGFVLNHPSVGINVLVRLKVLVIAAFLLCELFV